MKNYTYGHVLINKGYVEVDYTRYNIYQENMSRFIHQLSKVVRDANCGWSGIEYVLMKRADSDYKEPYMVLCVDGRRERWIPIDGNSKGCNISVLGENLW